MIHNREEKKTRGLLEVISTEREPNNKKTHLQLSIIIKKYFFPKKKKKISEVNLNHKKIRIFFKVEKQRADLNLTTTKKIVQETSRSKTKGKKRGETQKAINSIHKREKKNPKTKNIEKREERGRYTYGLKEGIEKEKQQQTWLRRRSGEEEEMGAKKEIYYIIYFLYMQKLLICD